MITSSNAFAAYVDGGGLTIGVNGGVAMIAGVPTFVPGAQLALTANTTNYIVLSLSVGILLATTTGFGTSGYPIATVVTSNNGVKTLTDNRVDVMTSQNNGPLVSIGDTNGDALLLGFGGSFGRVNLTDSTGNNGLIVDNSGNTTVAGASTVAVSGSLVLKSAASTVASGQVSLGSTTSTSANAGSNGDVPAQVVGYLIINVAGTAYKVPYYAT